MEKTTARPTRLNQISVEGYRSCRDTTLSLNQEITALIGINGAGKTNLLSAIRLLSDKNRRTSFRTSESPLSNKTTITAWFEWDGKKIGYRAEIQLAVSSRNTDEIVSMTEQWNLYSLTKSRAWKSIPHAYLFKKQLGQRLQQAKNAAEYDRLMRQMARYEYDLFSESSKQGFLDLDDPLFTKEGLHNTRRDVS